MTRTLSERRTDFTRSLILETAIELLEESGVRELTMRRIAKQVGMSERSMFRYFATRDEFLDAVADEARARLALPPPPKTIAELRAFPRALYTAFEAKHALVAAGLQSEIFSRMREAAASTRWTAVRKLIDEAAPRAAPRARKVHGANICYLLGATSWHCYRIYFRFSLDDTIACAETGIALALDALGID
jgi:AcrR family transcriptional regulator